MYQDVCSRLLGGMTQIVRDPRPGKVVRVRAGEPVELRLRRGRRGGWRLADAPACVVPLEGGSEASASVMRFLPFRATEPQDREVRCEYRLPQGNLVKELIVTLDIVEQPPRQRRPRD